MRKQFAIIALALLSVASANIADAALFGRRQPTKSAAECVCVLPKTVHQSPYVPYQSPLVAHKSIAPTISPNDLAALQDTVNDLNRQLEAVNQTQKTVKVIPVSHPAKPALVETLKGTAHLHNTAEDVYLVLLLPRNYQSCYPCAKLKSEMENPSDSAMRQVRSETRYKVFVEGDALYTQQGWGARNPEVAQGKTVVLAVQGNKVILKYVAPESQGLGDKLIGKLRDKICPKLCPNCPQPEPTPEPEPESVDPIPPTVEPIPETPIEEPNPAAALFVALSVGFVAWLVMFKRGV